MSVFWKKCIVCDGLGEIEITNRFTNLFQLKPRVIKCTMCQGKGIIPARTPTFKPWEKDSK